LHLLPVFRVGKLTSPEKAMDTISDTAGTKTQKRLHAADNEPQESNTQLKRQRVAKVSVTEPQNILVESQKPTESQAMARRGAPKLQLPRHEEEIPNRYVPTKTPTSPTLQDVLHQPAKIIIVGQEKNQQSDSSKDGGLDLIIKPFQRPPKPLSYKPEPPIYFPLLWKFLIGCAMIVSLAKYFQPPTITQRTMLGHTIPPKHYADERIPPALSNITLREFLIDPTGFHLGMAPAFFGFYGYFGALAAWDEELSTEAFSLLKERIRSVAGASAGAMAAVLIAAGVPPRVAAEFCTTVTLPRFADPPGVGAAFRGDKFEQIMYDFLRDQNPESSLRLEDAPIPVAVSGFDLQTMDGKILSKGPMCRAARASATFPMLFQPLGWKEGEEDYVLIDGGLGDHHGLDGLAAFSLGEPKRVVNLVVGNFLGGYAPGPTSMPRGLNASQVVSISLRNLPKCSPWALHNGPLAVEAARKVMIKSLDLPLYHGKEPGHFELHLDASSFVPEKS
jgi:hypothetical protein